MLLKTGCANVMQIYFCCITWGVGLGCAVLQAIEFLCICSCMLLSDEVVEIIVQFMRNEILENLLIVKASNADCK